MTLLCQNVREPTFVLTSARSVRSDGALWQCHLGRGTWHVSVLQKNKTVHTAGKTRPGQDELAQPLPANRAVIAWVVLLWGSGGQDPP
jgi:hypothetical protein